MKINIMHIYPDLLNLYGDGGNIAALKQRLLWRGIDAEVTEYMSEDTDFDLSDIDIVFLGGGTQREERIAVSKLMPEKEKLSQYISSGGVVLAVCGGFRMLGKYFECNGEKNEELGVLDFYAEDGENGFVGDVVMNSLVTDGMIVGFENHRERYNIGEYSPLGKLCSGNGNNGNDGAEGVIYKGVTATSLHGPLLPKNPKLCDYILEKALKKKYADFEGLTPLFDEMENKANEMIVRRYEG